MSNMNLSEAIEHLNDVLSNDKEWECEECRNEHVVLREFLQELQQYRSIGTVEECREAAERQKPNSYHSIQNGVPICDKCGGIMDLLQGELNYCPNCGQRLE